MTAILSQHHVLSQYFVIELGQAHEISYESSWQPENWHEWLSSEIEYEWN